MPRYSIAQAAHELGISKNTLRRWEAARKIAPPRRLARTGERIFTDENLAVIRAFMEALETPPPKPSKAVRKSRGR